MSITKIHSSKIDDMSKIDSKLRIKLAKEYKMARLEARVSGSEMGDLMGISAKYVYSLETGERILKAEWHRAYCDLVPQSPKEAWVYRSLGDRLMDIRIDNGLSIESLTDLFSAKKYSVQLWEDGSMPPSHKTLCKYASFFGADADELILLRAFDAIKEKSLILKTIESGSKTTVSILKATGLIRIVLAKKLAVMVKIGCIDRKRDGALWVYSLL